MQNKNLWRERLEAPLRDVLAASPRTLESTTSSAERLQQAVAAELEESVLIALGEQETTESASHPVTDVQWQTALARTVCSLGDALIQPDEASWVGGEDALSVRKACEKQQNARSPAERHSRRAAQQIESVFVWLSSSLHLAVTASASGFTDLCAPETRLSNEEADSAREGLIDADNPLAAPAPMIPDGVHTAVLAITNAILSLQTSRQKSTPVASSHASPLPALRQPMLEVWFTFVLHFLQQLSASGADSKGLWATFLEDCRAAAAKHAAAVARQKAAGQPAATTITTSSSNAEAVALWASAVTPTLMAETVCRTRFRRAAQLFRSNVPHLIGQAPHTAFLLYDVLHQFITEWNQIMTSDIPRGQLSEAAQALFSVSLFDLFADHAGTKKVHSDKESEEDEEKEKLKLLSPAECTLYSLVTSAASRLTWLLSEAGVHLHLVAAVLGSTLCTCYVLPSTTITTMSSASPSTPTTANATASSKSGPPAPLHVVGRRTTTSRSALTNSALDTLLSSQFAMGGGASGASPIPVSGESLSVADLRLRRHGVLSMDGLEALEAQTWLACRPIGPRQTSSTETVSLHAGQRSTDDWAAGCDYLCSETEWRLRQFAPLGLVLTRAGIRTFLPPHLFHWSTQLHLGTSAAQQREVRQRLAMAAFLCGVSNGQTAVTLYHYASQPHTPQAPGTTAHLPSPSVPPVYAALNAFTAAMESFVCKADMERVVEMNAGGGGASGLGVLQETARKRTRRGGRRGMEEEPAVAESEEKTVTFRHGEITGDRFTRLVYAEPMPLWTHFLSQASSFATLSSSTTSAAAAAAATTTPATTRSRDGSALAPECVTPHRFLMELLTARYFSISAALIDHWWLMKAPVNVLLVPRAALPAKDLAGSVNAQLFVVLTTHRWIQHWQRQSAGEAATLAPSAVSPSTTALAALTTQERVLREELLPLWRRVNTFCGRVDVLRPILSYFAEITSTALDLLPRETDAAAAAAAGVVPSNAHGNDEEQEGYASQKPALLSLPDVAAAVCTVSCADSATLTTVRRIFAAAEMFVMQVVFPCLRVMPPSPVMYDSLHSLFDVFARADWRVQYGADLVRPLHLNAWCEYLLQPPPSTPARMHDSDMSNTTRRCRRYPHDVLLSKERQVLFVQSLKRMNAHTVDYYRRLLKPVLFADPLFVVERLLLQAVGYENNFLPQHTRLLQRLPTPIFTVLFHRGLAMMHEHVSKEKLDGSGGGSTRVSLIASFLSSVWCDNVDRVDGTFLLRAAELALRGETRFDTVIGLELLKAIFYQLTHRTLEHEEQFNEVQCMALGMATTTRLFARGQMTSFRMGRWSAWLSPIRLQAGLATLRAALATQCDVPLENPNEGDEEEQESNKEEHAQSSVLAKRTTRPVLRLTLGQHLLLHLARRQARIYALQADLDGTMDAILATSSRDYNTLTDLLFAVEELLPDGPPESLLVQVALPHVAMRLSAKFRLKRCYTLQCHQTSSPSTASSMHRLSALEATVLVTPPITAPEHLSSDVVSYLAEQDALWESATTMTSTPSADSDANQALLSYTLLRELSYFSVAHLRFDTAPYTAAVQEMNACRQKIDEVAGRSDDSAGALDDCLDAHQWQEALEKTAHQHTYTQSEAARVALRGRLEKEVFPSMEATYVLAISHLLPRALLSLDETTFVAELLSWLLSTYVPATRDAGKKGEHAAVEAAQARRNAERVMDMMYAMVTQAATLCVGLTDGEAKRFGHLLQRLLKILQAAEVRMCSGAHPGGLCHALPPIVAAVVAAEEARQAAAGGPAAVDAGSIADNGATAAAVRGGGEEGKGHVGAAGGSHGAPHMSAEALAAAFAIPGAADSPLLIDVLAGQASTNDTVIDPAAATASASVADSEAPASLLQLEAFLLRLFTSILRDHVNVPPHLHRRIFLILERVDKRCFPTTRLGTDLLVRVMKSHGHESNPNFASAMAVLKGLRDSVRHRQATLNLIRRFTETAAAADRAVSPLSEGLAVEVTVNGTVIRTPVSGEAAVRAIQDWHRQWRLREAYMGQLLSSELQDAGLAGANQEEDEDEEEEDAEEAENATGQGEDGLAANDGTRHEEPSAGHASSDEEDRDDRDEHDHVMDNDDDNDSHGGNDEEGSDDDDDDASESDGDEESDDDDADGPFSSDADVSGDDGDGNAPETQKRRLD